MSVTQDIQSRGLVIVSYIFLIAALKETFGTWGRQFVRLPGTLEKPLASL